MPRRTPVRELQAEENSDGPLRRSSRIAQNSPDPARIIQRRNSGNINETPAKITRAKRLSLSQESNLEPVDSKSSSELNQAGLAKRTRLTRSASKSPTALAKELETKPAAIRTRGRRGSLSKSEEVIDSPAPGSTRSRSTRSESTSPTSLKDVEAAKPRTRRGSISDKISQLEKIEEVEQSSADPKRRYRGRHSSIPEMSQLDVIRESETEKKEIRQTTQSISEDVEGDENVTEPKLDAEKTEESNEENKANKMKLSPIVRIEKSRVIADLTTSSKSENTTADKTLESGTIDRNGKDNDNTSDDIEDDENTKEEKKKEKEDFDKEKIAASEEQKSFTAAQDDKDFKKNGLGEEQQVVSDVTGSTASLSSGNVVDQKPNHGSVSQNTDETQENIDVTTASKLAVEDQIVLENIDKLLNTDKSIERNSLADSITEADSKESTKIRDEKVDTSEEHVEIDVVGDESPHETDTVLSKTFEITDQNNIVQNSVDSPANKGKTVLAGENDAVDENPKDKSLSNLLPNQLNVSVGSDGSFRMNLSLHDTETGSSQEDLFPPNTEQLVTEENTLNTSGNSDKENTKSMEHFKESIPKSKTSNEQKVPLTNVSFNEITENSKPPKGSPNERFCEPMEVDDPPLTYREITATNKRQSLNNREKSLTPTKKSRRSTDKILIEETQKSVLQSVTTVEINEKDERVENTSKIDISLTKGEDTMNNENGEHASKIPIVSKEESIKIDSNTVEDEVIKTQKQVEEVESPPSLKKLSRKPIAENSERSEETCASPVFSLSNTDISDEEENNSPNKQKVVEESPQNKKVALSEIITDTDSEFDSNIVDISKGSGSKGDKRDENVISSESKIPQSEHMSAENLTTPSSLEQELQSSSPITSNKRTLQAENPANEQSITGTENLSSDIASISTENEPISDKKRDHFVNDEENSTKDVREDRETDEPIASTSKAENNVTPTNSPSPKKVTIVSNVVITSDTNNEEKSDEKDSNIQSCKKQKISDVTTDLERDNLILTENEKSSSKIIKEHQSKAISSETANITDIDTNIEKIAAGHPSRTLKKLKPTNIEGHAVVETETISKPNKDSTQKGTSKPDAKNKSLKKKYSKTSNSEGVDDLDEKVEKLIEDALNEVPSSSSDEEEMDEGMEVEKTEADDEEEEGLENTNEYIDDMAEEVEDEEETPSEDSNEIVCEGESIHSSDTYTEGEDDSDDNDSFIDDGEEHELLSGEEDFLQNLSPRTEKTKLVSPQKCSKKHKRIITPSESEDENQVSIAEIFPDKVETVVEVIDDDVEGKVSDDKTTKLENETAIVKRDIKETDKINNVAAETQTNIPVDLMPSKNDIIYVDNDSDSVSSIKEESTNQTEMNISSDKKSKRKSSITIQENIKLEDVQDGELSERISKVVDWFYSGIKGKKCDTGSISFNVSLDYDDQSSVEENVTKDGDISTKLDTNKPQINDEYVESKGSEKAVMEEEDDVFVSTVSKTEKTTSPKKLKKLKRESLQQSDDEEIPTLVEIRKESSSLRDTFKQSPKSTIQSAKTRTSGTKRLSGESIQHLSPKRSKLGTDFVVEDIVSNENEKRESKKAKSFLVREMKENLEISSKKIKKKDKTETNEFKPVEVHTKAKKIKTKNDDENLSTFSNDVFATKNKSSKKKRTNFDNEFDVEIDHTNSNKKKRKYTHATKETDHIPCSSGILKLHVSTDTNVSKREVERCIDKGKKLKRNVSQKLLPTRKVDLNDSWESEIFDVSLHPSVSNKKMSDITVSKKKKTEGPFSSKDFKNRMLYDSSRIKRVDTKILLRQRRNL